MPTLKVHNSLQPGAPVEFEPREQNRVSFYSCGPTVYDLSHLGHARNYISIDVIRRLLMHYFGYNVYFVMNITDVDDKIIIKARRRRLFVLEKMKHHTPDQRRELVLKAFVAYAESSLPLLSPDGSATPLDHAGYAQRRDAAYGRVIAGNTLSGEGKPGDDEAKLRMHLTNMDAAWKALEAGAPDTLLDGAEEVLLPYLDSLYKETIDTSDQSIFTDLTRAMEKEFADDMAALNVLPPDFLTRVTEYVPRIVEFIKTLVSKGFAYEIEGSVYFDIDAFEAAGNTYARLRPESKTDRSLQEEGEGSLSRSDPAKKRSWDFALWKRSCKGEPYWDSPWGAGRPGWHIECSAMASDKLGEQMDIHAGGIDLQFPHHDNELAQSEAYYHQCGRRSAGWVRYFLHTGRLSIAGSKMSKSLKNYQTIQDALATTYTARNMRIVFLLGRWNDGVEISDEMRKQADGWEGTIGNFFTNVKSKLVEAGSEADVRFLHLTDAPPAGLAAELEQAKKDVDAAFSDSFDTPTAMQVILRVVRNANIHMSRGSSDLPTIKSAAQWVTKIAGILGLDANARPPYAGLGWASSPAAGGDVDPRTAAKPFEAVYSKARREVRDLGIADPSFRELLDSSPDAEFSEIEAAGERDPEALALPYVRAVSRLRDALRRLVSSASPETKKTILSLSDRVRDYDLTALGVQLDDQPDGKPSLIKFVPAAELIEAREKKLAEAAEKARAKEEVRKARERAEEERLEKAKVTPGEMFKTADGLERYAEWDADGVPTKAKDGTELPKSQIKKLRKEWERQKKAHDEYLAKAGGVR